MVKDTINTVKSVEKEAAQLSRETSEKKEKMLIEARQEVLVQKSKLKEALLAERQEALSKATLQNEKVMEEMMAQTEREISLLQKQVKEQQEEVDQLIRNELVG